MQVFAPLASGDFLEPAQEIRAKIEVYDGAAWQDLSDFLYLSPLPGWAYRKRILLPASVADLPDFPVCIKIVADADMAAALANGHDIRFTDIDGNELPYERESWSGGGGAAVTAIFWVKTDVATAGTHIWLCYGNPDAADGENAEAVWDSDFKAVYHMKDATTSTILDSTENDNDGTKDAANQPVEADGKVGKGQDFDSAANENIDVADDATLDGTAALTISAWVNPETNPAWATLAVKGTSTTWNSNHYTFGIQAGRIDGRWNGKGTVLADAGDALSTGSWQHVAFVVEAGTTNAVKAYKNGALIKQANRSGDPTPNASVLRLGSDSGAAGGDHLNGVLDEVRVSASARSADWLAYEYDNMNAADGGLTWGEEEPLSKDLIEGYSISLGGAGMQTAPIAGTWSATIANPGGIFHPRHPTSPYADLLRVGREVRISVGGVFDDGEHYFQRLIGFMDAPRFTHSTHEVQIGGMDYMKLLADTVLRDVNYIAESGSGSGSTEVNDIINGPLHWGGRAIFDSLATGGVGAELYAEGDACEIGVGEADDIGDWAIGPSGTVTSEGPGNGSSYYLRLTRDGDWLATGDEYADESGVGAVTAGQRYIINFDGRVIANSSDSDGHAILQARQGGTMLHATTFQEPTWRQCSFIVTAASTGALALRLISTGKYARAGDFVEIDNISVKTYDPETWNRYELPIESNGPYFVTLDGEPIGQGDQDSEIGWHYDLAIDAIYFAEEMTIPNGTDNLWIYYYTDQVLENVLADLLRWSGLYATREAALADLDYTPTGVTIPRSWFDPDTTALAAIAKICERVDYRFWFGYDGKPHFQPAPEAWAIDFDFGAWGQLRDLEEYQDDNMVRNRIVIEGSERAMYQVTREDKANDRFKAVAEDATSIEAYLEKTYSIQNHLFQDQASVDALAPTLLARFKDPKWYASLALFANAVPLELGDVIAFPIQLEPAEAASESASGEVAVEAIGIIRDIKISNFDVQYKVELVDSLESASPSESPSASPSESESASASASASESASLTEYEEVFDADSSVDSDARQYWDVPAGCEEVEIEIWGPGGQAYGSTQNGGAGGGGAAYSKKTLAVTPTETLILQQAWGGSEDPAEVYQDTTICVCRADYGRNATGTNNPGAGGLAGNGIGDTKYSGGDGDALTGGGDGGGGGGCASGAGDGGDASGTIGGNSSDADGGDGGDGTDSGEPFGGTDGEHPGGGGGGWGTNTGSVTGGAGAGSRIRLRYWAN